MHPHFILLYPVYPAIYLDDGNPDGFLLLLRLHHQLHQPMKPDAGVHHHTLQLVLAHQDAALGIFGIVAGMDTDALEIRHAHQIWQPLLEFLRHGDEHMIGSLGDGSVPRNLSRHLATHSAILAVLLLGLQFHPLQVAPRRLQGVAEVSILR